MEPSVIKPLGKSLYTRLGMLFPFIFGLLMVLVTLELWPDPFEMFMPILFALILLVHGMVQRKQIVMLSKDELIITEPFTQDQRIQLSKITAMWHSRLGWTFFHRGYKYNRLTYTYDDKLVQYHDLYLWDKEDVLLLIKTIREMHPHIESHEE